MLGLVQPQLLILFDLAGDQQPGDEQHGPGHVCGMMGSFFCHEGAWGRIHVHVAVEDEDGVLQADQAGSQA